MKKIIISSALTCLSFSPEALASGSLLLKIDRLINYVEMYPASKASLFSHESTPEVGKRNFRLLLQENKELRTHRENYPVQARTRLRQNIPSYRLKMNELVWFLKEIKLVSQIRADYFEKTGISPYVEFCTPSESYHWQPSERTPEEISEYVDLIDKYISLLANNGDEQEIISATADIGDIYLVHTPYSIQGGFVIKKNRWPLEDEVHIEIAFTLPRGVREKKDTAFSEMMDWTLREGLKFTDKNIRPKVTLSALNGAAKAYLKSGFVINQELENGVIPPNVQMKYDWKNASEQVRKLAEALEIISETDELLTRYEALDLEIDYYWDAFESLKKKKGGKAKLRMKTLETQIDHIRKISEEFEQTESRLLQVLDSEQFFESNIKSISDSTKGY